MLARNARILKANFSGTDFLNANCPNNSSWSWKCIHHIKEKIKPFISWIVGDGNFIDPWCDHWIPEEGQAKPKPNTTLDPSLKVSDLINPNTRQWDRVKLNQHFDLSSVEKIARIPLSISPTPDRRAWDLTKDGKFATKSAYDGLRNCSPNQPNDIWRIIKSTQVPHHVQTLLWKSLKNALPHKEILIQRIHITDNLCPYCHNEPESIMHALISCPHTSRIWFSSHLNVRVNQFADKSMLDWFIYWLNTNNNPIGMDRTDSFPFVAYLMWSIWISRNNLIHNNKIDPPMTTICRANRMLPKTNHVTYTIPSQSHQTATPTHSGPLLIKDGLKSILMELGTRVKIKEVQAMWAIWGAIRKAIDLKIPKLVIESDAESLVNQLKNMNFCGSWSTDALLKDIEFWSTKFENLSFCFIPRKGNVVAHELAQWGKSAFYNMSWSSPPVWLLPFLGRNQTVVS
ncbi:Reverse transcriptase zinc-binding domain [Macleaya cordata]|uniref:Reverse transcriptase zinc-binding domain n=1 Tax=Macleaya cordata TaxID=56857 RepID=A0A200QKH4_MACCD|nr:Reverse transcriptase zinc-binding domain [Macleaya cordata]